MEATTRPRTGIPASELAERRGRLLEHVRGHGLSGYVLFDQKYIEYFTSFCFLSTERPVVFAESASGETAVFVPEFEVERVRAETAFERVESYPEYPGIEHPMLILARVLSDLGIRDAVAADGDGYPGILGYQGPALSEVAGARVEPLAAVIESMMAQEERERDRADPRERPLVCPRAPAAPGLFARGRHGGRGEPAGGARSDARAAADARRRATASSRPRPTASRPATGGRSD